ncbi:MAG: DUF4333 domain-containing protein [Microthrixaceae bacterium]
MRSRSMHLLAVGLGTTFMFTACSSQATMSKSEAERQISSALEKQVGRKPDKVTCPDDIDAVVGRSMRCNLTADDTTYGLTMKITSVDGGKAKFDIKVDNQPTE